MGRLHQHMRQHKSEGTRQYRSFHLCCWSSAVPSSRRMPLLDFVPKRVQWSILTAVLLAGCYSLARVCTPAPLDVSFSHFDAVETRLSLITLPSADETGLAKRAARARRSEFRHISLCTIPSPALENLKESARWHGDEVTILGMGDPRFTRWGVGFGVKIELVQQFVAAQPPDTLVMFTDAFDVLLMAGQSDIRTAYIGAIRAAMARESDPARAGRIPTIVFSTERYSWPDAARAPEYPQSDRAFPVTGFLNSGVYMGPAGDLLRAMSTVNYTISEDDQRFWTSVYLKSRGDASMPRIILDHESDVFLGMAGLSPWHDLEFDPHRRKYKLKQTLGQPAVIHFNSAKADVAAFFHVLKGDWCPTMRWSARCVLPVSAIPATAAFLCMLMLGRIALKALKWLFLQGGAAAIFSGAAVSAALQAVRMCVHDLRQLVLQSSTSSDHRGGASSGGASALSSTI